MSPFPDLALIGCGAISEEFYLPAFAKRPDFLARLWLVDPSPKRLAEIADRFGVPRDRTVSRIEDLPGGIRAAFNATPSHLHISTTLALLGRGVNVFLEKPLGETGGEAEQMMAARGDLLIGINQYRRLIPCFAAIRERLAAGDLGQLKRITWGEGNKAAWPAQSPFYYRRPWADGQPRGTLLDAGSHMVDLLCWWLGGELDVVSATSDSYGGPEEYIDARFRRDGAEVELKIGMHVRMANRFSIEGEKGSFSGAVYDFRRYFFTPTGGSRQQVVTPGVSERSQIAERLIANFIAAIDGKEALLIDAATVVPSLRTIDAAYKQVQTALPGYYLEWQA